MKACFSENGEGERDWPRCTYHITDTHVNVCLTHTHTHVIHDTTHTRMYVSARMSARMSGLRDGRSSRPPQGAQDAHISRDGFLLIAIAHRPERYLLPVIIYEFARGTRSATRINVASDIRRYSAESLCLYA